MKPFLSSGHVPTESFNCYVPTVILSNEISERGDLIYAHVVYVKFVITMKMLDSITCQARDVTVCVSHSPSEWLPGNGGETKFSGEPDFKGQGQISTASCCFFNFF